MAAARQRRMDGTGDGEHLASAFARQPRRDERPALLGRFHYQHAARQSGHNAVAFGEVRGQGARAQRKFGNQRALRGDVVRQIAVAGGVDAVDAGAHDRHRARPVRAGVQRAFMRRRIDAQRQSADDAPAVRGQMAGEGAGVFLAPGRGVAGAHDGQRRALQIGRVARHVQQDGRVGDGQQALRIGRVGQRQDVPAGGADPFQCAVHLGRHVLRHGRGQLASQRFGNLADQRRGALRVDLFGQAERAQQHAGGGGTDVGFQGQPQPGGQFGGRMRKRHGQAREASTGA
ncbi:hypothetical protein ACMA110817_24400 [Achromobacter marplatensis]